MITDFGKGTYFIGDLCYVLSDEWKIVGTNLDKPLPMCYTSCVVGEQG